MNIEHGEVRFILVYLLPELAFRPKKRFFSLDYYAHLISIPEEFGGISVDDRILNIQELSDVRDSERGQDATQSELRVMLNNANISQKDIFENVVAELQTNTVAFISGAAGTGKSYLLKIFERHYILQGYKV